MACCRVLMLCLLFFGVVALCSGLVLERLPRHIPRIKNKIVATPDEESSPTDDSVERKKIGPDYQNMGPYLLKPTWGAIYPLTQDEKRSHKKRAVLSDEETTAELAKILKDDDGEEVNLEKKSKRSPTIEVMKKTKRQSDEKLSNEPKEEKEEDKEDFQEWLRREYYRNMAKSFASMRRKRESPHFQKVKRSIKKRNDEKNVGLGEITDNLLEIEDQLFQDALQTMRDSDGEAYEERKQNRIANDLSLAYDLETMRNAFFRLRETLMNMENENEMEEETYPVVRKRSRECPALDQLTSDCSSLSDVMPDGAFKKLFRRACNWHEVCYTCGKVFGLTSENCDGSFIEQTQTICQGDGHCESTASLLVVPLRQRRVFYKRSNPDVCADTPCVAQYLKEGLEAMQEGRLRISDRP